MFRGFEHAAMRRAIELALQGGKKTFPNPRVGAVIISPEGEIVVEGFHVFHGGAHAEINALAKAEDVAGCTMVVTLEPCSHHGKTPPCVKAIADSGISRVVVGLTDPNPLVAGEGIKFLRNRDIDVEVGLLKNEVEKLNEIYLHHIATGRSFVHLKMAGTLDGRSAAADGSSRWITGEESRRKVHEFRRSSHAVLVGRGTAVADNPELTAREVQCAEEDQPVRIVLARRELPLDLKLFNSSGRTVVVTDQRRDLPGSVEVWQGIETLAQLLARTAREGLGLILCEGGGSLAASLLREQLVDRLSIFTAPAVLGSTGHPLLGDLGIEKICDIIRMENVTVTRYGKDILTEGRVVYRID
ncbi:MAG: bifunctional diaminohydroxyphosphoribosylaminopyrimidine deaminase/5-amino-6-(5-phosphoribosylamino)uracil reductase RibD [Candidatus Sabulitectum sp.]|nr:bifunctional diaminohydroxyphosphoribosylaminopyrimidine deaminase/5-amino-6-(5-phosphoribosylamino)uracil reductase RibD [Candidatus Sabulitectum sp.]